MILFWDSMFWVDITWSQESNTIEFSSIGLLYQDIQGGMAEGQHRQNTKFDFECYDLHAIPYLILLLYFHKGMDLTFLIPV